MFRTVALAVVVLGLTGCASPALVEPEAGPSVRPTRTVAPSPAPEVNEPAPVAACIAVSATWLGHIQYFMEDGYTITRGAAATAADGYTSIAVLYTSPAGEEILGSWATGGDPSSETVMQVFPLDNVTGSHTVVMMPNATITANGSAGLGEASACLG